VLLCVWFSLSAVRRLPAAPCRPRRVGHGGGVWSARPLDRWTARAGVAAPGGPRVASPGAPALSELPLLPATPRRRAVSAARRRAARFGV